MRQWEHYRMVSRAFLTLLRKPSGRVQECKVRREKGGSVAVSERIRLLVYPESFGIGRIASESFSLVN
jgi:hypothetical protein